MWRIFEWARQDVRYAARSLAGSPAFTIAALLTLALGIGVNAAVFMLFDRVALRPLPVKNGDRVVGISETFTGMFDRKMRGNLHMLSYSEFRDARAGSQAFSALAAYADAGSLSLEGSPPEAVSGLLVTEDYFKVFAAGTSLGRAFAPAEMSGPHAVAVLSQGFWRRRFGADPEVVGKTIRLNGTEVVVIGVAAPGFIGVSPTLPDLWLPLSLQPVLSPALPGSNTHDFLAIDNLGWLGVVGRLKDGETIQGAQANLQLMASRRDASYPGRRTQVTATVSTFLDNPDAQRVIKVAGTLAVAAMALVLLVACANVANLLLARATSRQREIAVRLAIGASRRRLIVQLLTESGLLALAGGTAGLLLAYYGLEAARSALYASAIDLRPDASVLRYSFFVSLAASLVCGLAPALPATSPDVFGALKDEGTLAGMQVRPGRIRSRLVTMQVAVCCLFLVAAGLLVRGLLALNAIDPGFQVAHVLVTSIAWQQPDGDAMPRAALYRDLLARFDSGSGTELSLATVPPFRGVSLTPVTPADSRDGAPPVEAHVNHVSANYFRLLGIPLLQGRGFSPAETVVERPDVAVISDAMRRQYWRGESPIGQRFRYGQNEVAEVIGVAADIRASHVSSVDGPSFYLPIRTGDTPAILAKSADPHSTAAIIEHAVRQRDALALVSTRTLEENLRDDLTPSRIGAAAALALAMLAMALAAVGIYGVTAYTVTQRTREVGVRLALGAEPSVIHRLIVGQAMRPVAIGALVGLPAAAVVALAASKLLLGVRPLDPVAFLAVSVFLAAVAFVASYVPARRATRVNAVVALRHT